LYWGSDVVVLRPQLCSPERSFGLLERTNEELKSRVQARTEELSQTLTDLKEMQTQLVQTEKMSSLGHMVAGIAHEINNPASFVHGNLTCVDEYLQDVLSLTQLYQKHYPNPIPEIQDHAQAIDIDFIQNDLFSIIGCRRRASVQRFKS
jgi:two-component system, NtrC family, sensor kinase